MDSKVERLILMAQKLAEQTPRFFEPKGPGEGDRATNEFMENLRTLARETLKKDYSEQPVRKDIDSKFDFYFSDEGIVVEVALGLHNPMSEYEKDIFKCLLGKEAGLRVDRLVFIGKPGAEARQTAPAQKAVAEYVRRAFNLSIDIWELAPRET